MGSLHRLIRGFLFGLAWLVLGSGLAVAKVETINIGVLLPMTGKGAFYGVPAEMGVRLAVNEINARGHMPARVQYFVRDTLRDPHVAARKAKELIDQEKVGVLIGGFSSEVALAISEVARKSRVLFISSYASSIQLTRKKWHPHVFSTAANAAVEGEQLARIAGQIGSRLVCFVGFDETYSAELLSAFRQELRRRNQNAVVSIEKSLLIPQRFTKYDIAIEGLLKSNCDTVIGALWGAGFVSFVRQAKAHGLYEDSGRRFIWGANVGAPEIARSLARDYPVGHWVGSYDAWYYHGNSVLQKYHQQLAELTGKTKNPMAPITTYIAVQVYAQAVEIADSVRVNSVLKAMESLRFQTPYGVRFFNRRHEMNVNWLWGQIDFAHKDPVARIKYPVYR